MYSPVSPFPSCPNSDEPKKRTIGGEEKGEGQRLGTNQKRPPGPENGPRRQKRKRPRRGKKYKKKLTGREELSRRAQERADLLPARRPHDLDPSAAPLAVPPRHDAPPEPVGLPQSLVVHPELAAPVPTRRVRRPVVPHEDRVVLPHGCPDERHAVVRGYERGHRHARRGVPQPELTGLVPTPPVRLPPHRDGDRVRGRGRRGDQRDLGPAERGREEERRGLQLVGKVVFGDPLGPSRHGRVERAGLRQQARRGGVRGGLPVLRRAGGTHRRPDGEDVAPGAGRAGPRRQGRRLRRPRVIGVIGRRGRRPLTGRPAVPPRGHVGHEVPPNVHHGGVDGGRLGLRRAPSPGGPAGGPRHALPLAGHHGKHGVRVQPGRASEAVDVALRAAPGGSHLL